MVGVKRASFVASPYTYSRSEPALKSMACVLIFKHRTCAAAVIHVRAARAALASYLANFAFIRCNYKSFAAFSFWISRRLLCSRRAFLSASNFLASISRLEFNIADQYAW